jgi:hypothetical protein
MFPYGAIPALRRLRGPKWQALVERVMLLPEAHEETLALMLTMIRLNGCVSCETDSYRAMRGCCACAIQTLRRYKGDDDELIDVYYGALRDVAQFLKNTPAMMPLAQPAMPVAMPVPA